MSLQTNDADVIDATPTSADPAEAAIHLLDYPEMLFDRLAELCGVGQPGQRMLDIATGTGALARGFARRGCFVTALDTAESVLDEAARRDRRAEVYVDYRIGGMPPLPPGEHEYDLVSCGRGWDGLERAAAANTARQALCAGGWLALVGFAPLFTAEGPSRAALDVLRQRVPDWPGPRETARLDWLDDLRVAGFGSVQGQVIDVTLTVGHDSLVNLLLAQPGLPARLDAESRKMLDQSLRRMLTRDFPDDPQPVPHRLWFAVGRA
jgi:SAM-dependent methyltransferase